MSVQEANLDENAPIGDDESVLRRILKKPEYYDPSLPIPVTYVAFLPTKKDTRGISVFRSDFVSPKQIAEKGTNSHGYCVAEIRVKDLQEEKMTAEPDPLSTDSPLYLPGHAAIPQINSTGYDASHDEKKMKGLALQLAILASKSIAYCS